MKTWVVTGASRGIGLEFITQLLATTSDSIVAVCRKPSNAQSLQTLLAANGSRLRLVEADVSNDEEVGRLAQFFQNQPVDFLINNAGIYNDDQEDLEELDLKFVIETFDVNVLGPMRMVRALYSSLKRAERPLIANISSMMGSISDNRSGGSYGYRMSKAALNMFTKNLAVEMSQALVLSLHPGWVQTDMGGRGAPVQPKDSVQGLLKVIRGATVSMTGGFFDYKGDRVAW